MLHNQHIRNFCAAIVYGSDGNFVTVMKVFRDGKWNEEDASVLVPGDIISIKLGDIVPADARLLEGDPLKIDQVGLLFALTFSI